MSIAAERKITILEALGRCLLKKSFRDTTIKDIAQMAGITHGPINYYFKDKEDILINFIDYLIVKYLYHSNTAYWFSEEHLGSIPPEKILEELLQFSYDIILNNKDDLKVFLELFSIANYNKEIESRIRHVIDKIDTIGTDILLRSGMDQESAGLLSKSLILLFMGIGMCLVALKYNDKQLTAILQFLTSFLKSSQLDFMASLKSKGIS